MYIDQFISNNESKNLDFNYYDKFREISENLIILMYDEIDEDKNDVFNVAN